MLSVLKGIVCVLTVAGSALPVIQLWLVPKSRLLKLLNIFSLMRRGANGISECLLM